MSKANMLVEFWVDEIICGNIELDSLSDNFLD